VDASLVSDLRGSSVDLRLHVDRANRKVERIEGDPDDPRSRGFTVPEGVCDEGRLRGPDRLRKPVRRTKGGWQTIGLGGRIRPRGSDGIRRVQTEHGPARGRRLHRQPDRLRRRLDALQRVLMGALRSPRMFSGATIDHFPKLVVARAMFGKSSLLPIPDLDRCDYFLCLGGNPLVSQGSLMSAPDMRGACAGCRSAGGRFVVVDPRRTESARAADEHVLHPPGADAFFLFAIVDVLFAEGRVRLGRFAAFTTAWTRSSGSRRTSRPRRSRASTGIPAETTRRIAREFSDHPHACCYGRIGTCTVEFGTLASWLVDVVDILAGRYDEPGGMMFPRPATGQHEPGGEAGAFPIGRFRSVVRSLPEIDGQLPCSAMAEEIDAAGEQRMRGLVTLAGNPVLLDAERRPSRPRARDARLHALARHLPERDHAPRARRDPERAAARARELRLPDPEHGQLAQRGALVAAGVRSRADSRCCGRCSARSRRDCSGATPEQLEEQLVLGARDALLRAPGRPAETRRGGGRDREGRREPGPMRILDLMLRAGPWGDGFDDAQEGLSLAVVRATPHALDLGPIEPFFPQALRTPGRRIPLAHPHITADVARLRAALANPAWGSGMRLVGRRQMRNMNSWLHNLPVLARGPERCTLLVHPSDAQRLGLADGGRARVRSRVGEVRAQVEVTDDMMPGVVCLPHGFGHDEDDVQLNVARVRQPGVNANALTDDQPLDVPSGTSVANGIPVEVSVA
jgi:anaerobic selenocysteine-containing dehydrogenase